MNKKAYFLIILLTCTLTIAFCGNAVAETDYEVKVEKDTELIFTVTIDDEDGQKDCDLDIDEDEGDQHKILIKDTGESGHLWIEYDSWDWIEEGEEFDKDPDDKNIKCGWDKDPKENTNISCTIFIPLPAEEFLKKCDFPSKYDYHIDQYIEISIEYKKYTQFYLFDTNSGYLAKMRYLNEDNEIVYEEYYRGDEIPGYEIPILLGILAILTAGIVYINLKQKKIFLG